MQLLAAPSSFSELINFLAQCRNTTFQSNISRCQKRWYIIRFKFLSQFREQNEKSCIKALPFISNYLEILKNIQYFRLLVLEIAKTAPGESNHLKIWVITQPRSQKLRHFHGTYILFMTWDCIGEIGGLTMVCRTLFSDREKGRRDFIRGVH